MKILSWNVRGLGRSSKRYLLKDVISTSHVDIVCLQESKLQELHCSTWRSIGGKCIDTFEFLPALGTAGGIIIAWDRSQVIGSLIHKRKFSITIGFSNSFNNSNWACSTSVYGLNSSSIRTDFWNELLLIKNLIFIPWVICGDFNTVFTQEDKNKGDINLRDISNSQNFLFELNLIDPSFNRRRFTWNNSQSDLI
ncbi:RNA-directed DNA polymerase protein [Dioscorea alata]|uniref:RNA-directed DNA polymerase protein n=1 Tax=Dioscorea alata TaxID=55571 RepID=A0ACB7VSV2_DIOAL|nr:RNA-directed DNA polymerase protein [Dioscorea alata]